MYFEQLHKSNKLGNLRGVMPAWQQLCTQEYKPNYDDMYYCTTVAVRLKLKTTINL